jgi:hypothetical protein
LKVSVNYGLGQFLPRQLRIDKFWLRREEALARFVQANWIDCKILAYPPISELSSFVGVNLNISPTIIMIDYDRETFETQKALESALSKTLKKIGMLSSAGM